MKFTSTRQKFASTRQKFALTRQKFALTRQKFALTRQRFRDGPGWDIRGPLADGSASGRRDSAPERVVNTSGPDAASVGEQ